MMRPIRSGYISFGLVNIPVSLYSAERRFDLRFHMLDSRNHSRIRYQRVNQDSGEEVPWNKVVKAYEYDYNNYVVLEDQDFEKVSVAAKTVAIEQFVDAESHVCHRSFDRSAVLFHSGQTTSASAILSFRGCEKIK